MSIPAINQMNAETQESTPVAVGSPKQGDPAWLAIKLQGLVERVHLPV